MTKEIQKKRFSEKSGGEPSGAHNEDKVDSKPSDQEVSKMPFLMLGLDLPPPPLFKDVMEKNIIPQVCLPVSSSSKYLKGSRGFYRNYVLVRWLASDLPYAKDAAVS